ncbi:hypothetical protein [Algoriphagus machipongonensis]|uniref:Enzyme of heme biosynthesis n=1 Tax=Algoriphagus machipongonensis TaxID=388413 RepID=A3HSA9_9BACT|nr:hypothetical protein [Algoriphagus machipongonensis]EAZ82727.1 hypothetical protein ALPR1_10940 [Algoriphagus machipongonensis]
MANLTRWELLKQFTKDEPENPFNWYALALEFREEKPQEAKEIFEMLLKDFKSYLPTYYTAASFFSEIEEIEEAKKIYENGIELASSQQNQKALQELKNAYQNFLFENDFD